MPREMYEYVWHVTLHDGSRFPVQAAYVTEGIAGSANGHKPPESSGSIVLKDKEHHPVFVGQPGGVICVDRGPCTDAPSPPEGERIMLLPLPEGVKMTPGQLADFQAALDSAFGERAVVLPPDSELAGHYKPGVMQPQP